MPLWDAHRRRQLSTCTLHFLVASGAASFSTHGSPFLADHTGHFLCLPGDRLCHLQEENVTPLSRYVCLLQIDGAACH